jgi:hypothetical protein
VDEVAVITAQTKTTSQRLVESLTGHCSVVPIPRQCSNQLLDLLLLLLDFKVVLATLLKESKQFKSEHHRSLFRMLLVERNHRLLQCLWEVLKLCRQDKLVPNLNEMG